jgi:hypothetical protein
MVRSFFRFTAALSLAFLILPPGTPAAPSAGLQYDEIVRFVVSGTPPPPGNFQADLAAIASPAAVAATAAPKRHGFGLGNLANIVNGNIAGAVGDAVVGNVIDAQTDRLLASTAGAFAGALRGLTAGKVERHSFFGGWERIDDVAAQTATIRKCDIHQFIRLDLAKKTYSIDDPSAMPSGAPAPAHETHAEVRSATPVPAAPGTVNIDLSTVVTPLGSVKIDGLDAAGYQTTSTLATTRATGSCKDGTFAFRTTAYYSRYPTPQLVCPVEAMPPARYPQEPSNFVASGGCRPTFSAHNSGPVPPAANLALYSAIALNGAPGGASPAPAASPGGFTFLTERGNLHSLGAADAALFSPPGDFTRVR